MTAHLTTTTEGDVLVVTLDRPEVLNALSEEMAAGLLEVLSDAQDAPAVRAVVLTGAGRGFCAGADVAGLAASVRTDDGPPGPAALRAALRSRSVPLATAMTAFEKPLVAAVHGPCAGAGLGLAMACDVVVAGPAASFSAIFVKRGLVPDYGLTFLLPRLVGLRVARDLCLTGRAVGPDEAVALGLASRSAEEPLVAALEEAGTLARGAGIAIGLTKRLLASSFEAGHAEALDREFTAQSVCFVSEDAAEGMRSFLEKRPAEFRWR